MKDIVMEWVKEKNWGFDNCNRKGEKIIPNPDLYTEKIQPGDIVIVVGTRQQIKAFLDLCGEFSV